MKQPRSHDCLPGCWRRRAGILFPSSPGVAKPFRSGRTGARSALGGGSCRTPSCLLIRFTACPDDQRDRPGNGAGAAIAANGGAGAGRHANEETAKKAKSPVRTTWKTRATSVAIRVSCFALAIDPGGNRRGNQHCPGGCGLDAPDRRPGPVTCYETAGNFCGSGDDGLDLAQALEGAGRRSLWKQRHTTEGTSSLSVEAHESLVPEAGIEPARVLPRGILSPLRLPISPLRRHAKSALNYGTVTA
jgi:hypothetical protein